MYKFVGKRAIYRPNFAIGFRQKDIKTKITDKKVSLLSFMFLCLYVFMSLCQKTPITNYSLLEGIFVASEKDC